MTQRRFPPPWTVEDIGTAFVVTDRAGQKLTYVYFEDEPERSLAPGGILIERGNLRCGVRALRSQYGFTRSNDAGGEINGSASRASR
jgi:hypothetical protein